ncbi:F-box only protein 4 isoform X2 [Nematostella vectensis]|uniref:F-box only protein 4 isoform X2 n=1 Tax=Nematostella vectensis TaxID=45351 RepID=UPI0020772FA7|nr:F-box only protein 4 isoform X2 [Nematostella vectensis]XP_032234715.2 F-box only protein 4 isoform X2 [Nematostella vectensis]
MNPLCYNHVNLQLYIFSYLNAKTLSGIARTCKYWKMLSEDKILWENLLWTDLQKWKFINHRSYPYTYLETNSELTPKQIYLRCCPECQKIQQTTRNSFTSLLLHTLPASMFQRHPPKVVMFGPGLESDTHKLVQKLLWDKTISPATVDGMFPGEFEGIGSGVCLKIGGSKMNLITLYATNRAEREQNAREGRNRVSKLLAAAPPQPEADGQEDNDDGNDLRTVEVSHGVRLLCQNVDAFIYVVDSSAESQRVNIGDKELQAMMNNSKSQPRQPLLVLSAVATQDTLPLSCVRVTDMLQMNKLNRPWQVNMMCVENLDGLLEGMTWLLKQVV